jgi:hypothetical protein
MAPSSAFSAPVPSGAYAKSADVRAGLKPGSARNVRHHSTCAPPVERSVRLHFGAWRWEPERVNKRRCGSRRPNCRSRLAIRSTCASARSSMPTISTGSSKTCVAASMRRSWAAEPAAGALLPAVADRLLRGPRRGTRHRLARDRFARGPQFPAAGVGRGRARVGRVDEGTSSRRRYNKLPMSVLTEWINSLGPPRTPPRRRTRGQEV